MTDKFKVKFLPEAADFMEGLDNQARMKIYFNIRKAQIISDPVLLKKLNDNIWEFRTQYNKTHYRLFAFWDKRTDKETIVLTTHGLIKKTGKTPQAALDRAEHIRQQYFIQKTM